MSMATGSPSWCSAGGRRSSGRPTAAEAPPERPRRAFPLASPAVTVRLAGLDLAGGAIGRLGGHGQDLIAYAHTPCAATPRPGGDPLVVVDLRNGSSRTVLDGGSATGPSDALGPWIPILADLDDDGVDEAIVRQAGRVVVVDPGQDWRVEQLAVDAIPLAVTRGPGQPNVVALYRPAGRIGDRMVDLVAIGRTRPGDLPRQGQGQVGAGSRSDGTSHRPCPRSSWRPTRGRRRRPGSAIWPARAASTWPCPGRPSSAARATRGPGPARAARPGR